MSVVAVAAIVVIPSARACFVVKFAWTSVNAMRAVRVAGVACEPGDRQVARGQRGVQVNAAMRGDQLDTAVRLLGERGVDRLLERRLHQRA